MEKNSLGLSFLDRVLARMRRADRSLPGHWQRIAHRWLSVLEKSRALRGYCALWRHDALPIDTARSEPTIRLDSVFFLSLITHVGLLLLLAWVTVQAKPSVNNAPIRVTIMDSGKQAAQPAARSKPPARRAAKKTVTKPKPEPRPRPKKKIVTRTVTRVKPTVKASKALPKPKSVTPLPQPKSIAPAAVPEPNLPAPKVLARSPAGRESNLNAPGDPLVRLPTKQTTPAVSASDVAVGDTSVSEVTADLAGIPKELMRGKGKTGRRTARRSLHSADVGAYLKVIQERVKAVWRYPSGIRGMHRVNFSMVLDKAGKLVSVRVLDSTHSGLNPSATEAVRLAGPFPPMPQDLQWLAGQPIRLRFNVNLGGIR